MEFDEPTYVADALLSLKSRTRNDSSADALTLSATERQTLELKAERDSLAAERESLAMTREELRTAQKELESTRADIERRLAELKRETERSERTLAEVRKENATRESQLERMSAERKAYEKLQREQERQRAQAARDKRAAQEARSKQIEYNRSQVRKNQITKLLSMFRQFDRHGTSYADLPYDRTVIEHANPYDPRLPVDFDMRSPEWKEFESSGRYDEFCREHGIEGHRCKWKERNKWYDMDGNEITDMDAYIAQELAKQKKKR